MIVMAVREGFIMKKIQVLIVGQSGTPDYRLCMAHSRRVKSREGLNIGK